MDINFLDRLQSYLRDHGFEPTVLDEELVEVNAQNAKEEYDVAIKSGYSGLGATELAYVQLFRGIGDSPMEVLSDIFEDNFSERLNVNDQEEIRRWVNKISDESGILDKFKLSDGLGLDPNLIDGSRDKLISRIDQYLNTYGI